MRHEKPDPKFELSHFTHNATSVNYWAKKGVFENLFKGGYGRGSRRLLDDFPGRSGLGQQATEPRILRLLHQLPEPEVLLGKSGEEIRNKPPV